MTSKSECPIEAMTNQEAGEACWDILDIKDPLTTEAEVVGLIIAKLQEWKCRFSYAQNPHKKWLPTWYITRPEAYQCDAHVSLQLAFLKTAVALGHWSPPQKVEEEPKSGSYTITFQDDVEHLKHRVSRIERKLFGTSDEVKL